MVARSAPGALSPGIATGLGGLPHTDPDDAARLVLRCTPALPSAPRLPVRTPLEGSVAAWAGALPEVVVAPDGSIHLDEAAPPAPPRTRFDRRTHGGLLAFLDRAASLAEPPRRLKVEVCGPLTLGLALETVGMATGVAFQRAGQAVRAWIGAVEELAAARLPGAAVLTVLDEPALVAWRSGRGSIEREAAVDLLSGALAVARGTVGVRVPGAGDRRLALEAGPKVVAVEVRSDLVDDAVALSRHLDAEGWVAWGAVPTDRPIGEAAEPFWRRLVGVWCELTRRGCDPVRLRTQALVTPARGLAGHGTNQVERILGLARDVADRVQDQAVAARLSIGA